MKKFIYDKNKGARSLNSMRTNSLKWFCDKVECALSRKDYIYREQTCHDDLDSRCSCNEYADI